MPAAISQSSFCGRATQSNACTLISLHIAELIHLHDVAMPAWQSAHKDPVYDGSPQLTPTSAMVRAIGGSELVRTGAHFARPTYACDYGLPECPSGVLSTLLNGILDGNATYDRDAGIQSTRVYNLPDAIHACGGVFKEIDFTQVSARITSSLPKLLRMAIRCKAFLDDRRLFVVMIGCLRTVLLVYDRKMDSLTLFDSHTHSHKLIYPTKYYQMEPFGALIATTSMCEVESFAHFIENEIFPDLPDQEKKEYEISVVRFASTSKPGRQVDCALPQMTSAPVPLKLFPATKLNACDVADRENDENFPSSRRRRPPDSSFYCRRSPIRRPLSALTRVSSIASRRPAFQLLNSSPLTWDRSF